jgi:hypothetical protein
MSEVTNFQSMNYQQLEDTKILLAVISIHISKGRISSLSINNFY